MDNLTHSLTGLMLSRAGLSRWCPRATALLVLASNAPDIDVITSIGGSLTYLDHHRGITHGLVAIPAVALLVTAIVRLFGPLPWLRALVTSSLGVLLHLLLDWTNTYGIRFGAPFSEHWYRLDITNVIDLWILAALALAVLGPLLSRLVSSEIGAKGGTTGRGAAIFALSFLLLYDGWRFTLHARAVETLESHLYEGRAPRRAEAYPHFANPWHWITVVDTGPSMVVQRISLLFPYDPTGGLIHYQPEPSPALDTARGTATLRRYLGFNRNPLWQVTPLAEPDGGQQVEALDLRFGDPPQPRFVATVRLDRTGRVIEEAFSFGPLKPR